MKITDQLSEELLEGEMCSHECQQEMKGEEKGSLAKMDGWRNGGPFPFVLLPLLFLGCNLSIVSQDASVWYLR